MLSSEQKEQILGVLAQHPTAVISTADRTGTPGAAVVLTMVTDDLQVIFGTHPTRKYTNLKENPKAAFAFAKDWMSVQMHGAAEEVTGPEAEATKTAFMQKHPELNVHMMDGSSFFRFVPSWIRYMDNGARPPVMWEATLTE